MALNAVTTIIFAASLFAGLGLAALALIAPDLPSALHDLRRRPALPTDDHQALAAERSLSRRVYQILGLLGVLAVPVVILVLARV
jgi:hypothetical protein